MRSHVLKALAATLLMMPFTAFAAAPTIVTSAWVQMQSGTNPTPSIASVASGDALLAVVEFNGASDGTTFAVPTDSSGQTWGAAVVSRSSIGSPYGVGIEGFVLTSANPGTHTVTFTNPGYYGIVGLIEIHGSAGVDQKTASSPNSFVSTYTVSTGTLAVATELAIGMIAMNPEPSAAGLTDPPIGWTSLYANQASSGGVVGEAASLTTSSTSAVSPSWSWTGGTANPVALVVTFKGSSPHIVLSNGKVLMSGGKPVVWGN